MKYRHDDLGLNSRLDTLQAAILLVKLRHLEDWNQSRSRHAARYSRELSGLNKLKLPSISDGAVYHLYVIRLKNRDYVVEKLNEYGIGAAIHYPYAVHEHKAYEFLGYPPKTFPVAETWARQCLSLPIYPELDDRIPACIAGTLSRLLR